MSSFDKTWLALREGADGRARSPSLVAMFHERAKEIDTIIDIGCGTGSTYRALAPDMAHACRWTLIDNDERLLSEARSLIDDENIRYLKHDLQDVEGIAISPRSAITASAFFDLCSEIFVTRFVDHVSSDHADAYIALNYNGEMAWSHPHPLDEAVVAQFNAHQRTDKGFGPALGPEATDALKRGFENQGYTVRVGDSPWRLTSDDAALQLIFLDGIRSAVQEINAIDGVLLRNWYAFRITRSALADSLCDVGHQDLFACRPS